MTYILLILTALFWGGTFIAGRILAGQVPPLCSSFLRFLIAAIALLLILVLNRNLPPPPPRKCWFRLLLLGFTGVFSYNILFFTGLERISAGRAGLIIAATPLVITILSALIYRERLTLLNVAGILLALTGALFVISNGHISQLLSGGFGQGELAIIGCVLCWAAYTVFGRSVMIEMSPLSSVLYSILAGTAMLLLPALLEGLPGVLSTMSTQSWGALVFLGVFGTALGFTWYYKGIEAIGVSRASIFINMVPVFAILLSWLILSESFRPSVIIGGTLVLCGVRLANSSSLKRNP